MLSNIKNSYLTHLTLLILVIFSAAVLLLADTNQYPYRIITLIFLEYLFLIYIFYKMPKNIWALLLFIFPFFKLLYFWLYAPNWVNIGDFRGYLEMLTQAFSLQGGITTQSILNTIIRDTLYHAKFYYLTIINMYLPMKLYGIQASSSDANLFLFFNDFIFVILTAITVTSLKGVVKDKIILIIVLFLLFSPTTLANTIYPDRHIFTLFALLWFIRGMIRIRNKECRIDIYLLLGIITIFINKPQLVLGLLLYIILSEYKSFFRWYYFSFLPVLIWAFFYYNSHIIGIDPYLIHHSSSAAFTSSIHSLLGPFYILAIPIVKYTYAILSPFPWFNLTFNLSLTANSYLSLLMVYMNAVFGLSIPIGLLLYFSYLRQNQFYFKNFTLYGLIMSLSIIPSDIGHSGYLSVYYVLFTPMYYVLGLRKSFFILYLSLTTILMLNFLVFIIY